MELGLDLNMETKMANQSISRDDRRDQAQRRSTSGSGALGSRQAASTGLADLFQADKLPQKVWLSSTECVEARRPPVAVRR